jgi:hypothetical protein
VSQSQRETVVAYIDRQAEHHAKWSFEQEFLTLLKKSGVAYDRRFVFGSPCLASLRDSRFLFYAFPALKRWAMLFRADGAGSRHLRRRKRQNNG